VNELIVLQYSSFAFTFNCCMFLMDLVLLRMRIVASMEWKKQESSTLQGNGNYMFIEINNWSNSSIG
jgi:hypothetical protein